MHGEDDLNKVTLIGHVGKEPEIRTVGNSGKEVANFSLATSDRWKDKNTGEYKSKTEWHNVVVWNEHLVGVVKRSVKKGTRLYIEGALEYRKWQDKNGVDRISAEIVLKAFAGAIILLDRRLDNEGGIMPEEPVTDSAFEDDDIPF
jgi:single-strand DNA-binding protein